MYFLTVILMVHGHQVGPDYHITDHAFRSVQECAAFVVRETPRKRKMHGIYICSDGDPYDDLRIPF